MRARGWAVGGALLLCGCYRGGADGAGADGTDTDPASVTASASDTDGDTDADTDAETDGIPDDIEPDSIAEPIATRLTDAQYGFTVLDILGIELNAQEQEWLPRDVPIEGSYSTSSATQFFNTQYVLGYAYIARSVSDRLQPAALLSDYGGCDGTDAACIEAFADGLGLRMFRRPLTDDERQAYVELATAIADGPGNGDDDVVRGLVQAMMQAPQFLYRLEDELDGEPGALRRISGYELASRLSYFLWLSAPDQALLEFAAEPYDADATAAQVERMIADPKFSRSRALFWGDYSLASVSTFASAQDTMVQEFRDSLLATLDRISGVDGPPQPLSALFGATELVMTPGVAALAGVADPGDGLQVYDVADLDERLGVITHPGFLAAVGTTSFVGRGLFLTERLLCQHVAAPPDDENTASAIMDTAQQTADLTPREASEFRFGLEPVCQSCHRQFEPIAYAFERYAIDGAFGLTDDAGRDLFSDGELPAFEDRPRVEFDNAPELLAELPSINTCFVENMMEYASGAPASDAEAFVEEAAEHFADEGQTFDALVSAVGNTERLSLMRVVEP